MKRKIYLFSLVAFFLVVYKVDAGFYDLDWANVKLHIINTFDKDNDALKVENMGSIRIMTTAGTYLTIPPHSISGDSTVPVLVFKNMPTMVSISVNACNQNVGGLVSNPPGSRNIPADYGVNCGFRTLP